MTASFLLDFSSLNGLTPWYTLDINAIRSDKKAIQAADLRGE